MIPSKVHRTFPRTINCKKQVRIEIGYKFIIIRNFQFWNQGAPSPLPLEYSTSVFWRSPEVEAGECPTGLARRVLVPSQWNGVGANDVSVEHGQQCRPAVPWFRYRLLCQRRRSQHRVSRSAEFVEPDVGWYTGRSCVKYDRRRVEVKTGTEVSHAACTSEPEQL